MSELKALPLGIQDFEKIITNDFLYIDKTTYIHQMVKKGGLYFLSRPRRFGKSVLINTLQALYQGRRELFEGLYIADKWDWQPRPIIRLDFLGVKTGKGMLEQEINDRLDEQAAIYGVKLEAPDSNRRFRQLILELSKQGRVVVLIDEYDKPILDQISNQEQAEANRKLLATFYAVLKSLEHHLEFLLMTGVSKFSKVSLFSDLNNLTDITLHPTYGRITGYTQQELDHYFSPYLEDGIGGLCGEPLRNKIKDWYNGYSWDGKTRVYNPVSVLQLLYQHKFDVFWFATGTPRFLIELLRQKRIDIKNLPGMEVNSMFMEGYEPDAIDPVAMLFQTGYLTIKEIIYAEENDELDTYQMDYPNFEVRRSFLNHLLADYAEQAPSFIGPMVQKLKRDLGKNKIDAFCQGLQGLFATIPYNAFVPEREGYYQTVIYLILSLLGLEPACEVQTNKGRVDAVLETSNCFYVVEFKIGSALEAIDQIKEREYAAAYAHRSKPVKLLGIGIDPLQKNIHEWICENN